MNNTNNQILRQGKLSPIPMMLDGNNNQIIGNLLNTTSEQMLSEHERIPSRNSGVSVRSNLDKQNSLNDPIQTTLPITTSTDTELTHTKSNDETSSNTLTTNNSNNTNTNSSLNLSTHSTHHKVNTILNLGGSLTATSNNIIPNSIRVSSSTGGFSKSRTPSYQNLAQTVQQLKKVNPLHGHGMSSHLSVGSVGNNKPQISLSQRESRNLSVNLPSSVSKNNTINDCESLLQNNSRSSSNSSLHSSSSGFSLNHEKDEMGHFHQREHSHGHLYSNYRHPSSNSTPNIMSVHNTDRSISLHGPIIGHNIPAKDANVISISNNALLYNRYPSNPINVGSLAANRDSNNNFSHIGCGFENWP